MIVMIKRKLKVTIVLLGIVLIMYMYMISIFSATTPIYVHVASDPSHTTLLDKITTHITNIVSEVVTSSTKRETTHLPLYSDNIINPDLYDFTIRNGNYCQFQNSSEPFLVILVKCSPTDLFDRQQIRQTWGGTRIVDGRITTAVFLLGMSESPDVNKHIQEESEHYHDIVQENFIDAYHNLTIKTMMGLKWVTEFCRNVSYVASVDADVLLNTYNLVRRLRKKPREGYAEGSLRKTVVPVRHPEGHDSKWYTSKELYPEATYAPFFPGSCYVMSVDVASAVYRASEHVRYLPWDDVFVGLAMKRAGIEPKAAKGYDQYAKLKSNRSIKAALVKGIALLIRHQSSGVDERLVDVWNSSMVISMEGETRVHVAHSFLISVTVFIAIMIIFVLIMVSTYIPKIANEYMLFKI